jgi:hypothetical protein
MSNKSNLSKKEEKLEGKMDYGMGHLKAKANSILLLYFTLKLSCIDSRCYVNRAICTYVGILLVL